MFTLPKRGANEALEGVKAGERERGENFAFHSTKKKKKKSPFVARRRGIEPGGKKGKNAMLLPIRGGKKKLSSIATKKKKKKKNVRGAGKERGLRKEARLLTGTFDCGKRKKKKSPAKRKEASIIARP